MRAIGICGGGGVILHPFKNVLVANFEIRSIFHSKDMEQWKANFGDIPYFKGSGDLMDFPMTSSLMPIDIVVGAPDCGHSSLLAYSRAKKLKDPKENESLRLFIRGVKRFRPKLFLMENLTKLLDQYTEEEFRETFKQYHLIFHNVSVSEFGNSQINRKRLVLIGINKPSFNGYESHIRDYFSNIYKVSKLKTAGELVAGLEKENHNIGNIREPLSDIITIYSGAKLSLQDIKDHWDKNPDKKRFMVTGRKFTTAPGVYRNLYDDFPATARKANRQYNHLGLQLTPRELARIQGVPDRFKIYIDPKNPGYWINKGRATVTKTPPYEIGYWFYKQCKKVLK